MIFAVDGNDNYIKFTNLEPMAELMFRGQYDLAGKYFVWDLGYPPYRRCGLIDDDILKKDIRFFQMPFIIHHNLQVGTI